MDLVTIDRFTSSGPAAVARATLEAAGIDAFLADEIDAHSHGGVRLQVARDDVPTALDILREAHAAAEVIEFPREPLDPTDDYCRRCGSEEVYPLVDRGRAYARALVLSIFGALLMQLLAWIARAADFALPRGAMNAAFLAVLAAPLLVAVAVNISPRMQCRNCRLEWRGRQWTA
jgi:Putative prokaryotic signal transducing protein